MTITFKLELADGTPADPPTIGSTVTNWRTGDTIPIAAGRCAARRRDRRHERGGAARPDRRGRGLIPSRSARLSRRIHRKRPLFDPVVLNGSRSS
jgi:hypothetical protein